MSKPILLDAPNVGKNEKEYLIKAIDTGYVSTIGPFVEEFEKKFASYIGMSKAVSLQSGTAAITMALYELGIKKNDEVIVPALTFIATVNPIIYAGAKPVFADVDINTWNISPEAIEKAITKKTRAIIPVHLYGNPCDMKKIMDTARKNNLYVIEDATESLGAKFNGKQTGTFGTFGCFSFNGNKTITTGGGGMMTGNKEGIEHIKFLINQARSEKDGAYYHPEIGFNYRMTNIEAALGLAQMKKLNYFLRLKKKFNKIYKECLKEITFQQEYEDASSSCWLNCFIFNQKTDISDIQKKLKKSNIHSRRIFMPLTEFPPYKKYKTGDYKNSYYIYEHGLCLPSSTLNSENDIHHVCKVLDKLT